MEPKIIKNSNFSRSIEEFVIEWVNILNGYTAEDVDLDHVNHLLTETCETPSDLTLVLRRYQKEFLAWALKQEQSDVKGGILADDMGMGKTVQAISLVLAKRAIDRTQSDDKTPMKGFTLVICSTLHGIEHWYDEISQSTAEGTKVLHYHLAGYYGTFSAEDFASYDFVLTTYSIVTRECYYKDPFDVELNRELSPLHSFQWNRIILDEVCFLRIHLYGSYFCNLCTCEPADHIEHTFDCRICSHTGADHTHFWYQFLTHHIEGNQDTENKKRAKILLKDSVLKGILIRRTY